MCKINVKKPILEIVEKNNLEILKIDFIFMHDEVLGTVYCRDKNTKEPVWIESWGDEGSSRWKVNIVPKFYRNQSK